MADASRAKKLLFAAWGLALLGLSALIAWLVMAPSPETPGDARPVARQIIPLGSAQDEDSGEAPLPTPQQPQRDIADFQEEGPSGPLPRIADDGTTPLQAFAAASSVSEERARIALVVTGLGLSRETTEKAITMLPADVTLAFSPYGYDLENWSEKARQDGHELLVMVPMEPLNYPANDPGPHVLLRDATAPENLERLHYVMARFPGYIGIVNAMGSRITANEEAMQPVIDDLAKRGLLFLDAKATRYTVAARVARDSGVPWAINNRFIDINPTEAEIRRVLTDLETTAKTVGTAVGLARPLPLSIDVIAEWAASAPARGVALVPLSALAGRQPLR